MVFYAQVAMLSHNLPKGRALSGQGHALSAGEEGGEKKKETPHKRKSKQQTTNKQTKTRPALCFSAVRTTDLKIYKVGNGIVIPTQGSQLR